MKIHHLKPAPGSRKSRTRKGRGESAGKGKTAGRGMKGTKARGQVPAGFEGGQLPLQRRLPKIGGFTNPNRVEYRTVNVGELERAFADGTSVGPDELHAAGLVRKGDAPVKVLGDGELSRALTVRAHAFSGSARRKIDEAGGSAEQLSREATGRR
ncbi:50S ribosomal protein L15 [Egibacter rhizosphaerae]|uniref:Large ribosomal subunit protein uL15 n=1 Tax=Egibacter rhizosphaerae TaxID=1670831 RepID=A0A411YGV7_9ACTN|nr:50S ribosomal protein L15 [Egibacter rhizosphaerae]QBI20468.1 50S ribosomal protein L15 [Egibacter rhizosphaerae]